MDYIRADKKAIEEQAIIWEGKNKSLEDYLSNERAKWQKQLLPLYAALSSDMPALVKLQTESLNLRQLVNDSLNDYLTKLSDRKAKLKKIAADRMEYYMTGFGIKTSNQQTSQLLDRDLRENQRSVELLEIHVDYLRECRYSCDQIGYAMKNRVALLGFMQ